MAEQAPNTPTPAEPQPQSHGDARNSRFDAFLAVMLGVTAILTAMASYQGSLKDGDVIANYSQAQQAQSDGNTSYLDGLDTNTRDSTASALIAQTDDPVHIKTLKDFMSDPFRAWYDDPKAGPEDQPDPAEWEEADKSFAQASTFQKAAEKADVVGDDYNLVTVLAAVALFFFGVAGVATSRIVRRSMTAVGVVGFLLSLFYFAGAAA